MSDKINLKKVKKKEKWNIINFTSKLQEESILGSYIEIVGNNKFTLEGCLGVEEYTEEYLKIKLQKGNLILYGKEFDIVFYENKTITIKGKISTLEFSV